MKKYLFEEKPGIFVHENVSLKDYTTFALGGPCPAMVTCMRPQHVAAVVSELNRREEPFMFMGGGSNLVVADAGLDRVVVSYMSSTPCIEPHGDHLVVSGSTLLDGVAHFCAVMGLDGMSFATGIPGTFGGAIVGNAGAFGKQISEVIESVTLMSPDGEWREVTCEELGFDYRTSALQKSDDIVVSAVLALGRGDRDALNAERERILALRAEKHPDWKEVPCAGSVFRNLARPEPGKERKAAGWLLEQAGAKEMTVGGAGVYEKHANIVVKKSDDCTAQDVYDLVHKMQTAVREQFEVELEQEIRFVGDFTEG